MRSRIVIFGVAALALAVATSAEAQKPISIGIAGGMSMPQGDYGDLAGNGYNGTVALGLGLPMLPVGVRVEGSYNRFSFSDDVEAIVGESGNWSLASATANVTFGLPGAIVLSPYVIGGGGMYWGSCSLDNCDTESDFGINGGVGVKFRLALLSAYAEARYHSISTEGDKTTFVPITFGIMF